MKRPPPGRRRAFLRSLIPLLILLASVAALHREGSLQLAYIGPGAGFAFLGSFLSALAGFLLSFASLLWWPFRMLWGVVRRRRGFRRASVRKVVFLGLDGLDPGLAERWMAEGKLPNLSRLRETGGYRRLRTTFPSLSPVAWSTFATGVSPARHNIFDFLNRDLKSYLPELSSAQVRGPRRLLRLGKLRIPLSRPRVELRRKSKPFWKILGEYGIASTILRVPITFPPEKFNGRVLSAMCTPDLKGTQGSFLQFTTRLEETAFENGSRYPLQRVGDHLEGAIEGPADLSHESRRALQIPFRLIPRTQSGSLALEIGGESHTLVLGEYSPWIRLTFRTALRSKVTGVARFLLTETSPGVSLYVSPINIDPENPALPISHPACYATYLAKLLGVYATVGMAEDTWALNEGAITAEAFLKQAFQIFEEREAMFASALEKTRQGVVACVFDTSDRVQHMFYRSLDPAANQTGLDGNHGAVIQQLYQRMDRLVGKTLAALDKGTILFVLSDHGFCSFRRGVNLNAWLHRNGYLTLQEGVACGGRYFQGVDWSRTRAYSFGLAGVYLNLIGRERLGAVKPGLEADELKSELAGRLSNLLDPERNEIAIRRAYVTDMLYKGPYLDAAPDLIVGYGPGYRASWDATLGVVAGPVFQDNTKAWSGDHCVDPVLVPGVLFANRRIESESPGIEDLAPTALHLFGLEPPAWMEGKPVLGIDGSGQC